MKVEKFHSKLKSHITKQLLTSISEDIRIYLPLKVITLKSTGNDLSMMGLRFFNNNIVKPVLSGHSKMGKTKVLKTNGSLIQMESIAECSLRAFYNTFDLH